LWLDYALHEEGLLSIYYLVYICHCWDRVVLDTKRYIKYHDHFHMLSLIITIGVHNSGPSA